MWVKAAWIPGLFAAFDAVWPNRLHDQDGTIGDAAHRTEVSGHNPDDTPGVKAERQDADSIPEVRAADVDARGVDMDAAIASVLQDRSALALLIYIIWNGHIWRAAAGWAREVYAGSDPHRTHAHFSGHPDADATAFAWACIRNVYQEDSMGQSFGPTPIAPGEDATSMVIPPVAAGLADPRDTWLNVGADTNGPQHGVRVWATNGDGKWFPINPDGKHPDGKYVLNNGAVLSLQLPQYVRLLSVSRFAPAGGELFAGSVSACFERK